MVRPCFDLRGGPFDFTKVVGCQFDCGGANVFFQTTLAGADLATATAGPSRLRGRSHFGAAKARSAAA
jgi:hypothetical protein